ncbi:ABC transporter ATP-binding protein [Brevibacterium album]|uniref:ABC transporter ATP-binding protein n=1 Tax=Brevibacterium album TaxID=417948 RepID=UPI000426A7C9|nr:ABC transporter ATP-binding protein [Brevibacterium album]
MSALHASGGPVGPRSPEAGSAAARPAVGARAAEARPVPHPDEPLLRVEDLRVVFDGPRGSVTAVDSVSLTVRPRETVAVVGESGSGKSVTARTVLGLSTPPGRVAAGAITFDGRSLVGLREEEWRSVRGSRISMVFQDPMRSLNPTMKVGKQIEEALRLHTDLEGEALHRRAVELLDAVRLTDPARRVDEYPHQLSGGMRQRVMIALALSCGPGLLIADEPTTALDVTTQKQILDLVRDLQDEFGMALMLITHDIALASNYADTLYVMHAGRVVESGPAARVLSDPQEAYTRGLLDSVLDMDAPRPDAAGAAAAAEAGGARQPYGASGTASPTGNDAAPDVLLSVRGLEQEFRLSGPAGGTVRALDGVSFDVRRGETLSIVGESGSGKSTTARAILRAPAPTGGSVVFEGTDLTELSRERLRQVRTDMQMVFQDPFSSLNPGWKVRDIIAEPLRVNGVGTARERARRVEELLSLVGLDPATFAQRTPRQMSGGQAQRVGIARALALDPKLLICDESVSSLDVTIQAQVLELFARLGRELGLTYLFIAHDLAVVRRISDRVGVMFRGRLVELGPAEAVCSAPAHPYTRALLEAVPRVVRDRPEFGGAGPEGRAGSRSDPAGGAGSHPAPSPAEGGGGAHPDPAAHGAAGEAGSGLGGGPQERVRGTAAAALRELLVREAGEPLGADCVYAAPECAGEHPPMHEVAPGHYAACHSQAALDAQRAEPTGAEENR